MTAGKRAAAALIAVAAASGCVTAPTGHDSVAVKWEVRPDTDSCGKLAGSLAIFEILGIDMPEEFTE